MPFCVSDYEFRASHFVNHIVVSDNCCFPTLIVDWTDFFVKHRFAHLIFRMPSRISINFAQARALRQLLNGQHSVLFYVRDYRGHVSLMPLTDTIWALRAASHNAIPFTPDRPPLYPRLIEATRF
jgi:hypothetical protein